MAEKIVAPDIAEAGNEHIPTYKELVEIIDRAADVVLNNAQRFEQIDALLQAIKCGTGKEERLADLGQEISTLAAKELDGLCGRLLNLWKAAVAGLPRKRWDTCPCPDCRPTDEDRANEARCAQ
jgi:hypothetical protein